MGAKKIIEAFLAEMALTLKPHRTGLPFEIWLSEEIYATRKHHRPRLKIRDWQRDLSASISIDEPVQILAGDKISGRDWKKLVAYIRKNQLLLLQLWRSEIDQVDYQQRHQPLKILKL